MYSRSIHYLTSKLELYTEFGRKNGKLFTHPFQLQEELQILLGEVFNFRDLIHD